MIGTIINVFAILIGGSLGLLIGGRLPERLKTSVINGMGLFTLLIGIKMFLDTQNPLVVLGSLVLGVLIGEWWKIEQGLQHLGEMIDRRFPAASGKGETSSNQGNFVRGFMIAALLFCIGPMAILGSIQAGLTGDYNLLIIKSVLDGFSSIAFASTLGAGVLFSAPVVLVYQGAITLLAVQLNTLATKPMLAELSATGGVLLVGIAVSSLLEVKKIRMGNFLPALFIAPLIVWIIGLF